MNYVFKEDGYIWRNKKMQNFAKVLLLVILSLSICFFIDYSATVTNLHYDSYSYYGFIRDLYQNGGNYFNWDAAPGANLFEFRYFYSYLIGKFSYSSYILFFSIVNLSEVLFLILAFYSFLFLVNRSDSLKWWPYIYLTPAFVIVWLVPATPLLFFSNLFLVLVDTFILFFVGFFINILSYSYENKRLPLYRIVIFILTAFYFSATNLRFASSALVSCLCILTLLFLISNKYAQEITSPRKGKLTARSNNLITSKDFDLNNLFPPVRKKIFFILAALITVLIGISYVTFFSLETYSSTKRYVFLFNSVDNANQIPFKIVLLFFSNMLNSPSAFILSAIYLIMLVFGGFVWFILFSKKTKFYDMVVKSCPLTSFFSAFAFMSLILVAVLGIIQGGVHFWSEFDKIRYFEVSILFMYIAFSAFLIERITILKNNSFMIALIILIIGLICSIYNFSTNVVKKPYYDVYSCIKDYQEQYHLHDGIGSETIMKQISAYGDKSSELNTHILGGNPPMVSAFWVNNVYQHVGTINYLVYMNNGVDNSQNLAQLNQMVPNVKTTSINCGAVESGATILVFDDDSAKIVTQIYKQYTINARSYFTITNYGWEQSLWKHTPWHHKYISQNHIFYYNGIMLQKMNQQVNYTNNDDLSVNANLIPTGQNPIFSSGYIYVGNSKFTTTLTYASGQNLILAVVNLKNGQIIKAIDVPATFGGAINSISEDFSVNENAPIAIMVVSNNNTSMVMVKSLALAWDGINN
jgi:hypothetical protein